MTAATAAAPVPVVSSEDRDAWLAGRRTGVTATEVRDIVIGRETVESIARKKVTGDSVWLGHIPTVAWGNFREDAIAEELEQRYAITGSRMLFRHPVRTRDLATPDGVGTDFDGRVTIAEIKTGSSDLTPGGAAYERKGYGWQVQWQLHVMGADRCAFAWEKHDNDFTNFDVRNPQVEDGPIVDELRVVWVDRDQAKIDRLIGIADAVLTAVDLLEAGEEIEVVVDEELDTHALNYLRGLAEEKAGAELKKSSIAKITERMELTDHAFRQRSALAQVSWPEAATETVQAFVLPEESEWPADVREAVARERYLQALHQERSDKAKARAEALLEPLKTLTEMTTTKSRRPTVTAVKPAKTKETKE